MALRKGKTRGVLQRGGALCLETWGFAGAGCCKTRGFCNKSAGKHVFSLQNSPPELRKPWARKRFARAGRPSFAKRTQ